MNSYPLDKVKFNRRKPVCPEIFQLLRHLLLYIATQNDEFSDSFSIFEFANCEVIKFLDQGQLYSSQNPASCSFVNCTDSISNNYKLQKASYGAKNVIRTEEWESFDWLWGLLHLQQDRKYVQLFHYQNGTFLVIHCLNNTSSVLIRYFSSIFFSALTLVYLGIL